MKIKMKRKSKWSLIFSLLGIVLVMGLIVSIFATLGKSNSSNNANENISPKKEVISFFIGENEYSADYEMTWEDWISSDYNTIQLTIDNDVVCSPIATLTRNSNNVLKNYYVIDNAEYGFTPILLSFSIGESVYQSEIGMTWSQWVNSEYNDNISIIDNFVYTQNGVITYNNNNILKTETIIEDVDYSIVSTLSFELKVNENGYNHCRAENNMTWAQWIASDYNYLSVLTLNGYTAVNNYYIHKFNTNEFVQTSDTIVSGQSYRYKNEHITFTIDNTSYTAESGMTWLQWVNSPFNINNCTILNNNIMYSNGLIANNGSFVLKADTIIANTSYTLENTISFNIGNTSYQSTGLVVQTTWQSWVNSAYNTDNYTIVGDYIYSAQNGVVTYNNSNVLKTDYIVADRNYTLTQTITFSDNFAYSYHAISGMTWAQFVNSDFNTKPFVINGNTIKYNSNGSSVLFNDTGSIAPTDVIVANYSYNVGVPVGDGLATDIINVGSRAYQIRRGATWSQWLENGYGQTTNDFTIDNNNYIHSQNGFVQYNNNNVVKTDTLVRGATYTIVIPTILFTIDNVSYTAQSGMTWAQWVASANNTASFTIDSNNNVSCQSGLVTYNNTSVVNTDTIVANENYTIVAQTPQLFTFTINRNTYTAESGMTWGDWVSSDFNILNFTINLNGFVYYGVDPILYGDWVGVNANDLIDPNISYYYD